MAEALGSDSSSNLYEPLPGPEYIRILKLNPGISSEAITCTLEAVDLTYFRDKYEAISYVWGDPNTTTVITCNAVQVPVTVNLADALETFRHPTEARTIWADALCINQQDNADKSTQVQKMGEIYENARGVLVWLGRDTEGVAEDCFQLISDTADFFDAQYRRHFRELWSMPAFAPPYPISMEKHRWANVALLFGLAWFQRVWVVQEVALAKRCDLFWGAGRMGVAKLFELALWAWKKPELGSLLYSNIGSVYLGQLYDNYVVIHSSYRNTQSWRYSMDLIGNRMQPTALFCDILALSQNMQATNPRDYIYAFLGNPLANRKENQGLIAVDYSKTVDEVFFDAACALLKDRIEAPWILCSVQHWDLHKFLHSGHPSWIPQWSGNGVIYSRIANPNNTFQAGGTGTPFEPRVQSGKLLEVAGFIFDRVLFVSEIIKPDDFRMDSEFWSDELRVSGEPLIDRLLKQASEANGSLAPLNEVEYYLTLLTSYGGKPNVETIKKGFSEYRRRVRSQFANTPLDGAEVGSDVGNTYLVEEGLRHLFNQRFIRTESGKIGLASAVTQVGDMSCIFVGVSVPFVLKESPNERYKLVGECYIHNVMDGEMMAGLDAGEFEEKIIVLE
ncbi:HET-domain-containing protein [Melanomma pulvis-pyrius CBS 109.77]|uniref:HET-domain-containing protein n=1 Tax=Melanomma pulvis-pyrius CBS 109.77 TaxID=1314802 RepID=A0A6A6WP48_9PLEO|nr:HET-domain-containing protein [Melanomma pulvis-pyrius CBS 109.77]